MNARNLGEARATLDEARVLLLRRKKSAPYPGEGCLPPLFGLRQALLMTWVLLQTCFFYCGAGDSPHRRYFNLNLTLGRRKNRWAIHNGK